jgi:nitrite reductase/ring-hydroxylating ferredoxin subunit
VSEWHDVGSAGDLDERGLLLARAGGREIGVLRDRATGAVHALRNRCPHHGAPLCLGTVRDRLGGHPAQYVAAERRVLHCPWHGWEFDLDSGRCPDDKRMRVAVYPVKIESGRVLIDA